jgi:hypothetical protein
MAEPPPTGKRLASVEELLGVVNQLVTDHLEKTALDTQEIRLLEALGLRLERLPGEKLVKVWLGTGQVMRALEDAAWPKQGIAPTKNELARLARVHHAFDRLQHMWLPQVAKELDMPPFATQGESEEAAV